MPQAFSCILHGGTVYKHSAQPFDADVGYQHGLPPTIEKHVTSADPDASVDISGCIVTTGLIDLHCHVFDGIGEGLNAEKLSSTTGVLTFVDAGSAGARTIDAFAQMAARSSVRILAWLNLSTVGLIDERVGELIAGSYLDVDLAAEAANAHDGLVIGFKARLSSYAAGGGIHRVMRSLRQVADEKALPVMVHIGDTLEPLDDVLPYLNRGDVVSHAFTSRRHGILDQNGRLLSSVAEAGRRGIIFDSASGRNHLSFRILKAAAEQGFFPDVVSSDATKSLLRGFGPSIFDVLSVLVDFGIPLERIIESVTHTPASIVKRLDLASFDVGEATVLKLQKGSFSVVDCDGVHLNISQRIVPVGLVRGGAWQPVQRHSSSQ